MKVPENWTFDEIWRALALPMIVGLMTLAVGREEGAGIGLLTALTYGGLLLFHRPPWPTLVFVGAYAGWAVVQAGYGAIGEGWRGLLREGGSAVLLGLVIGGRPYLRGERSFLSEARVVSLVADAVLSLLFLVIAVALARRDGWPPVLIFGLLATFLGLWWPGSESVRKKSAGVLGGFFALIALARLLSLPSLSFSLWPFAPMAAAFIHAAGGSRFWNPEARLPLSDLG